MQLDNLMPTSDSSHRHKELSRTTWSECKVQWKLAAPTIVATILKYMFTVVAELMAGHLGQFELDALAASLDGWGRGVDHCKMVDDVIWGLTRAEGA